MSIIQFEYEIDGETFRIEVNEYTPAITGRYFGPPDDAEEGSCSTAEWEAFVSETNVPANLMLTRGEEDDLMQEIDERMYLLNTDCDESDL